MATLAKVSLPAHTMPAEMEPIDFGDAKIRFAVERCRDKRVLDIGCVAHEPQVFNSRHFLHRAIHAVAAKTTGLDLHAEGAEHMRSRGFDVRVGNAEGFDLGDTFDVIYAGDIIEHLTNIDGFMRSVDAHLAEGGMLIVATPNPWFWRNIAWSVLRPEVPNNPEHTCWFCPRTWRQLAERYGFTLGQISFQSRYWRERLMPLPRGIKHTSWSAETIRMG
jgi:2-polyprenyl-3-methyl-5-hydroxy-6-metoxy-1,4-benzoquinol methylase